MSLPAEIANAVVGVFGLDNRPVVWRALRVRIPASAQDGAAGGSQTPGPITDFSPTALARNPRASGQPRWRRTEYRHRRTWLCYTDQDLADYFAQAGLAQTPRYVTRPVTGGATNAPAPDSKDQPDVEVLLDMEVAGTIAPGAELFMHFLKDGTGKQFCLAYRPQYTTPPPICRSYR